MFDYQAPAALLQDRIVLVTGAGSGIGRAAALSYAAVGATVILLGRTVEKLERVYDEIEAAGGAKPAIFPLDLAGAGETHYRELAGAVEKEFGRLDGLLHNAALLGSRAPIEAFDADTWETVMHVNLHAAFLMTRQLLPLLRRADHASIIFTSSGVGREPRAYWGAYAVSKCALEGLMQVLHLELENTSSIRVNSIDPGSCATAMRARAFPGEDPATLPGPEDLMNVYLYLMGKDSRGESGRRFHA